MWYCCRWVVQSAFVFAIEPREDVEGRFERPMLEDYLVGHVLALTQQKGWNSGIQRTGERV